MDKIINGYKFVLISPNSPEQYDVYKGKKKVAYVRLRYGELNALTKPGGQTIYSHSFNDFDGAFRKEDIRKQYLEIIAQEIEKFYKLE